MNKNTLVAVVGLIGLGSVGGALAAGGCTFQPTPTGGLNPTTYSLIALPSSINQGSSAILTFNATGAVNGGCAGGDLSSTTYRWTGTTGTFFSGDGQQRSINNVSAGPVSVAFDYFNAGTYMPSFTGFLTYFNTSTSLVLTLVSENRVELLPVTRSFISNKPEMSPWPENFTASTSLNVVASPVPEPETYAMMLSGLGLLAFLTRRKHAQAA